ncbi:T9SS type A sorting domain-containing protein [bacterium]|nr:T9SS type A sorting domain-containing protein [bacterium]
MSNPALVISSTIMAADVTLNYGDNAETITITDAGSGQTTVSSTMGESTTFDNPTSSLTINAGGGDDQIIINSFSASFNADLNIDGEGGTDSFTVNEATTISGGTLTVETESITTTAGLGSTSGNLFLYCNTIALGGSVSSSGMLFIQPLSGTPTIGLGGGIGTLNLDDSELGLLSDGFVEIVIGDGSSGDVDISSATFTDPVNINSGGSIKDGSGTDITAPSVAYMGTAAPGQSPGILHIDGMFAFGEGSAFAVEIGGTTPGTSSNNHDQIAVSGIVTISSNIPLNTSAFNGFSPSNGNTFTIIDNGSGSAVSGTFKDLAEGAVIENFLGSGMPASITYIGGGDGNDVVLTVDASLSVELHSLSAVYENGSVAIQWITESETDNMGFILERVVGENVETLQATSLHWDMIASYETHSAMMGNRNSSERNEYVFVDENVEAGQSYIYRLSDVNTNSDVHVYDIIEITLSDAPVETVLNPPFPNPFNPATKIGYTIAKSSPVEITIYDLLGRKVKTLIDQQQAAGSYNIYWHGRDEAGNQTATGTYVIVLKTLEGKKTQKVVMMR